MPILIGNPDILRAQILGTADHVVDVVVGGSTKEEDRPVVDAAGAVGAP